MGASEKKKHRHFRGGVVNSINAADTATDKGSLDLVIRSKQLWG